jgi:hypothetical protein
MILAAAGMGLLVWALSRWLEARLEPAGTATQVIALGVPVTAGIAAYFALAHMLRVEELAYARSLLGRRLMKPRGTDSPPSTDN